MLRPRVRNGHRAKARHLSFDSLESRVALSLFGEFGVNTTTSGNQLQAATASQSVAGVNGRSVVVWTNFLSGTDTDIKARLYNSSGQPVGNEIIINNTSNTLDSDPAVAMDSAGNFVVTWTRKLSTGDTDIRAARFTSAGVNRGGINSSFLVTPTFLHESDSSVAMDSVGNFVVSYTVDTTSANQDVKARMYSSTGAFIKELVVANSTLRESRSSVARVPGTNGNFAIAFQKDFSSTDSDIRLARYTSAGAQIGGTLSVTLSSALEQAPSVAIDIGGDGVVVYQKKVGSDFDIKARRFTAGGALNSEFNIRSTLAQETTPVVALHRNNDKFVVAFVESGLNVRVAEVSATNAVTLVPTVLSHRLRPAITIDGNGFYQLAYESLVTDNVDGSAGAIRSRLGRI